MEKEKIKEQILSIRASGVTNMLDIPRVALEAKKLNFKELARYLENNKMEYWDFILTGEF